MKCFSCSGVCEELKNSTDKSKKWPVHTIWFPCSRQPKQEIGKCCSITIHFVGLAYKQLSHQECAEERCVNSEPWIQRSLLYPSK